jgi:hypothetical protein
MQLSSFIVSGRGWQPGQPSWVADWDRGMGNFPGGYTPGSNAPQNVVNGITNNQFMAVHEPDDVNKMHEQHFERFLFRVVSVQDSTKQQLDAWQNSSKKKNSIYAKTTFGPSLHTYPICHLYNYQQINYKLALMAFQGVSLSRLDIFNAIKPIGICLNEAETSNLYKTEAHTNQADVRVIRTSGPQRMPNEFGPDVEEGHTAWAVFEPVDITTIHSAKYRIGATRESVVVVSMVRDPAQCMKGGQVNKKADFMWQMRLITGQDRPTPKSLGLVDGLVYRLGRVQHTFIESHNQPKAFFGTPSNGFADAGMNSSGTHEFPKERDSVASERHPALALFVDCNFNTLSSQCNLTEY